MADVAAPVAEIFTSVQGEGDLVGTPQVFLRLYTCDLSCDYCDTPAAHMKGGPFKLETEPGSGRFDSLENPLSVERALGLLGRISDRFGISWSAITGGEPLLHVEFLEKLLPGLKASGLRVLMETTGIHHDPLARVLDYCDLFSVDIKMPESMNGRDLFEEHRRFLALLKGYRAYLKVVVDERTSTASWERALDLSSDHPDFPLYLQPVTPGPWNIGQATLPRLLDFAARAHRLGRNVRILPQIHPAFHWK